jgi:hypothetical protein
MAIRKRAAVMLGSSHYRIRQDIDLKLISAKEIILFVLIAAAACRAAALEQKVRALRPHDTSPGEKAVLDNLEQRARMALASIRHPKTRQEAGARRPALRRQLRRSLGFELLPWPPNLKAQTVGALQRDGYRIEKIVFESLPGVSVPAHLYIPDQIEKPAPAILFYVGHWWPDSKARPDFQAFSINMARLGFVVLTWDPFGQGERGISSRDHRRTESLLVGVSQQASRNMRHGAPLSTSLPANKSTLGASGSPALPAAATIPGSRRRLTTASRSQSPWSAPAISTSRSA